MRMFTLYINTVKHSNVGHIFHKFPFLWQHFSPYYILPVHMSNPITPQHFITANVAVVFQNRVDCISYNSEFVVGFYDLLKLQKSKCNYEASLKSN